MPSLTPGALVAHGYDDRVAAMFAAEDELSSSSSPAYPARVTRVERSACIAVGPDGVERLLHARPLPAVGDWIVAGASPSPSPGAGANADDGEPVVRRVLPRWSSLTRADPDGRGTQTLAANVDLVAITTPADRPSPARVERELAVTADSGARPLVLVTKADLDADGVAAALSARLSTVDVLPVSAATGDGLDQLRARLHPHVTAVLLGPSGAGKSTLVNALRGDDRLATGVVRQHDRRGRHTTTSRQLVAVPGGGVIIDTPGLRALGLPGDVDLTAGFAEIAALADDCRFADCRHEDEPGCAVTDALRSGELDPDRLRSFRKLAREAEFEQRRHDPLAQRAQRRRHGARTRDARAHEAPPAVTVARATRRTDAGAA